MLETKYLSYFESVLMGMREKLIKEIGYFNNDVFKETQVNMTGDLSAYHSHMADQGTDAMEREKAFLFMSNEGRVLQAVNDALRKIMKNKFGLCEECGNTVHIERLKAIPYARLCIDCKQAEERRARAAANNHHPVKRIETRAKRNGSK